MAVISGINCEVDGVSSLAAWKIDSRDLGPEFATSDAPGAMGRAAGNKDWRGLYKAYGYTPLAAHLPGKTISFAGDTDASYGVSASAIVDRVTVTCPVEEGGLLSTLVEFSNNDASGLAFGAAGATVGATPAIVSAITRKVNWDNSDVSVRGWKLVLTCRNKPYVDTDTAGYVMRTTGNMDATFEWGAYQDQPASLPAAGDIAIAKFYVTATLFWQLSWGIIKRIPNYEADHESAENVAGLVQGAWTSQDGTSIGTIITPSTAVHWPVP